MNSPRAQQNRKLLLRVDASSSTAQESAEISPRSPAKHIIPPRRFPLALEGKGHVRAASIESEKRFLSEGDGEVCDRLVKSGHGHAWKWAPPQTKGSTASTFDQVATVAREERFVRTGARHSEGGVQREKVTINGEIPLGQVQMGPRSHRDMPRMTSAKIRIPDGAWKRSELGDALKLGVSNGMHNLREKLRTFTNVETRNAIGELLFILKRMRRFQDEISAVSCTKEKEDVMKLLQKAFHSCFEGVVETVIFSHKFELYSDPGETQIAFRRGGESVGILSSRQGVSDSHSGIGHLLTISHCLVSQTLSDILFLPEMQREMQWEVVSAEFSVLCLPVINRNRSVLGTFSALFRTGKVSDSQTRYIAIAARKITTKLSLILQRSQRVDVVQTKFDATQFKQLHANCTALRVLQRCEPTLDLINVVENLQTTTIQQIPSAQFLRVLFVEQNEISANGPTIVAENAHLFDEWNRKLLPGMKLLFNESFQVYPNTPETESFASAQNSSVENVFIHSPNVRKILSGVQVRWKLSSDLATSGLTRCINEKQSVEFKLFEKQNKYLKAACAIILPEFEKESLYDDQKWAAATPVVNAEGSVFAILVTFNCNSLGYGDLNILEAIARKYQSILESATYADRIFRHSIRKQIEQGNRVQALKDVFNFDSELLKTSLMVDGNVFSKQQNRWQTIIDAWESTKSLLNSPQTTIWLSTDVGSSLAMTNMALNSLGNLAPLQSILPTKVKTKDGLCPLLSEGSGPCIFNQCGQLEIPILSRQGQVIGILQTFLPFPRRRENSLDNAGRSNFLNWVVRSIKLSQLWGQFIEKECISKQLHDIIASARASKLGLKQSIVFALGRTNSARGVFADVGLNPSPFFSSECSLFKQRCEPLVLFGSLLLRADQSRVLLFDNTLSLSNYAMLLDFGENLISPRRVDVVNFVAKLGTTTIFRHAIGARLDMLEEARDWDGHDTESDGGESCDHNDNEESSPEKFDETVLKSAISSIFERRSSLAGDDFLFGILSRDKPSCFRVRSSQFTGNPITDFLYVLDGKAKGTVEGSREDDQSSFGQSLVDPDEENILRDRVVQEGFALRNSELENPSASNCIISCVEHSLTKIQPSVSTQMQHAQLELELSLNSRRFWGGSAGIFIQYIRRTAPSPEGASFSSETTSRNLNVGLLEAWQILEKNAYSDWPVVSQNKYDGRSLVDFSLEEAKLSEAISGVCSAIMRNSSQLEKMRALIRDASILQSVFTDCIKRGTNPTVKLSLVGWATRDILRCDRVTIFRLSSEHELLVPILQTEQVSAETKQINEREISYSKSTHLTRRLVELRGETRVAQCARMNIPMTHSTVLDNDVRPLIETGDHDYRYEIYSEFCVPLFDHRRNRVVGVVQACNKYAAQSQVRPNGGHVPAFLDQEMKEHSLEAFSIEDVSLMTESGIAIIIGDIVKECDFLSTNEKALNVLQNGISDYVFESLTRCISVNKTKESMLHARKRAHERFSNRQSQRSMQTVGRNSMNSLRTASTTSVDHAEETPVNSSDSNAKMYKPNSTVPTRQTFSGFMDKLSQFEMFSGIVREPKQDPKKLLRRAAKRLQQDEQLRRERQAHTMMSREKEDKGWAQFFPEHKDPVIQVEDATLKRRSNGGRGSKFEQVTVQLFEQGIDKPGETESIGSDLDIPTTSRRKSSSARKKSQKEK